MAPIWEGKKYKLDTSENFDEYMRAIGVGFLDRAVGNYLKPVVELIDNKDGTYTFNTFSTFKDTVIRFKPGVEFDEKTIDGRDIKSVCTFENENKLIHEQKGEHPTTLTREFKGDEMILIMTLRDIIVTRIYKEYKD